MNSICPNTPTTTSRTFRIRSLIFALAGIFGMLHLSAQTLKMQFTFGDTGTTTADAIAGVVLNMVANGVATDFHGAAGSGPGGQGKSLNLNSGAYGNAASPVVSTIGNSTINLGTISNFTVSMWLKPNSSLAVGGFFSRYFILGANGVTDDNQANSIALQNGSTTPVSVNHLINTTGNSSLFITNPPNMLVANSWTFLAMTFDGTNVTIYAGSETNLVSSQATNSASSGQTVNLGSSFNFFLGNRNAKDRVFQGSMADVRFYIGAASASFLESVRAAAIPPVIKAATGTDLTVNATWTGGVIPRPTDTAFWTNTSLGAGLTLGSATTWGNLRVAGALTDIGITGPGPLTLANGIDMLASTVNLSIATPVALGAGQTWNVNSGETLTASGAISGSGFGLTKGSGGTLTLSGANTYTGITTVNAGTLHVTSPGVLYSTLAGNLANAVTVNSGGVVEFDTWDYGAGNSFGTLFGNAANVFVNGGRLRYVGSGIIGGSRSFTIGTLGATLESANANATWTFSTAFAVNIANTSGGLLTLTGAGNGNCGQIISGTGGLTKSGNGTWTLSSTNTYTGATAVTAGELIGSTAGSCSNSAFTISSGATNGVKLAAANGQWTCNGLTYNSGTTYADFDFSSFSPSATTAPLNAGALTANTTVKVILRNVTVPAAVGNYPLIHYTGSDPSVGNFNLNAVLPMATNAVGNLLVDAVNKNVAIGVQLVVPNLIFTNAPGIVRIIPLAEILSNGLASSQTTPSYSITAVSGTSAAGGVVIKNGAGNQIKYTYPSSGTPTSDSFSYTISDGTVSATATVTIMFASVAGPSLAFSTDGFNHPVVAFHGIPGYSYHIQRATTLSPADWTNVQTVSLPSNGDGSSSWTDTSVDTTTSTAFYRLSYP